jgi:hypothetical protein
MPRSGPHRYDAYARAHKDDAADRIFARRLMVRKYGAAAVRGKQVDHIKSIKAHPELARDPDNLRLRDPHENMADKTFD